MSATSRLRAYREKRDFSRTPEPKGGISGRLRMPRFVVQKHQATTLHYDFRLQVWIRHEILVCAQRPLAGPEGEAPRRRD